MMSNLGTRAARDLDRELAQAYDGEIPPPFYWQVAPVRPPAAPRRPGELLPVLPYAILPVELARERAVSLEELEEFLERRARREELGG